jgi:anti-anti-sigma factor
MRAVEHRRPVRERAGNLAVTRPASGACAVQMLKLTGDFDLTNAFQLGGAISQALDAGIRDFVVDLADVSFLDASMLHQLQLARRASAAQNGKFAVVRPRGRIWRVFVLTGLADVLHAFASPELALMHIASAHN